MLINIVKASLTYLNNHFFLMDTRCQRLQDGFNHYLLKRKNRRITREVSRLSKASLILKGKPFPFITLQLLKAFQRWLSLNGAIPQHKMIDHSYVLDKLNWLA